MILPHCQWHPNLTARLEVNKEDLKTLAQELVNFHQHFQACFGRIEHQRLGLAYLSGLLSNIKSKSVEPIALEFLDPMAVRSLQRFMKNYYWDHRAMEATHQQMLSETISSADGMITVDSSEFIKKGKESVGVARQYCGAVGKVENCQSGVFVGYTSPKGYGLLTSQLYMPESWFTKEQQKRRKANLVPPDLSFKTKQQIALDLIDNIVAKDLFPVKWIGCDASFGADLTFLNSLPQNLYYFAAIRSNAKMFTKKPEVGLPPYKGRGRRPIKNKVLPGQPQPEAVSDIARSPSLTWEPVVMAEGAKGPIVAKVGRTRVYLSRNDLPQDDPLWLFMRRDEDGQIKYAISNAPEDIPFSEMCQASVMRWPIEQCFKDGKDHIGMDHYEHRSWPAWHRHMIYVFLALNFLLRLRFNLKKSPDSDTAPGPKIDYCHATASISQFGRGFEYH
jgi:SRSO17 transposase